MDIYKFRVLQPDNVGFYAEFEIAENQTFKDFHDALKKSITNIDDELASFFICDDRWQKVEEITLIEMGDDGKRSMHKVTMKEMIEDAFFRLVYEYDFLQPITLFFEHFSSEKKVGKKQYPKMVISKGKMIFPEMIADDALEQSLLEDFNNMLYEDDEEDDEF